MKFKLEITLENDAMRLNYHAADALRDVAIKLEGKNDWSSPVQYTLCQSIMDANGNRVGTWSIK